MLFPVIGIVEILSTDAHADRYTYLPGIGLSIAGAWTVSEWSRRRFEHRREIPGVLMAAVILALIMGAWRQTSYWRTAETLWRRTIACTDNNTLAHVYLGNVLSMEGKPDQAIAQYRNALAIAPDNSGALNNLGSALTRSGRGSGAKGNLQEAIACFRKALQIDPTSTATHYNLAVALSSSGQTAEAITYYRQAVETDPDFFDGQLDLGNALAARGEWKEAVTHLRKAAGLRPDDASADSALGMIFFRHREFREAIDCWQQALTIKPGQPDLLNNLAWVLATCDQDSLRDGPRAVALAENVNQLTQGGNAKILQTLAAAYAAAGRFEEAIATAQRALEIGQTQTNRALCATLEAEMKMYRSNTPLRN
jgi:Flp pilus assembly protein TadD